MIDTHTHFYDPSRPGGVPWPPADDKVLYRTVLPEHAKALAKPLGVTGTVVVEASRFLEDNQWILDLAKDDPFIVGFVGNLDINDDDFEKHLDRFTPNPLFRGIRVWSGVLNAVEGNGYLKRLNALAERDLSLDLPARPEHLAAVAQIARAVPLLRIVINHIGHVRVDGNAPDPAWVEGVNGLKPYPNVFMKVSGLVEAANDKPAPRELSYYAPTLDALWVTFGTERLVWGSNWPVSERFAPYATTHELIREYFAAKGRVALDNVFVKNSKFAYKWIGLG